jgi:orotate phosphoribosyltransferase
MIYHGNYESLSDLKRTVDIAVASLTPHLRDFDSIIVQGMSGVIVAIPVGLALDKPVVILRKNSDDHHKETRNVINLKRIGRRVLFLDDFVSLGTTRNRVEKYVECETAARMIGQYLYSPPVSFIIEPKRKYTRKGV